MTEKETPITNAPETAAPRRIRLQGIGAFLLALGCARSWLTLIFAAPSIPLIPGVDAHHVFDILFCAVSIGGAIGAARIAPLHKKKWATAVALGGMASASIAALAAIPLHSNILALASGALGGIGFAAFLLIWAETLSALSIARIALYSSASQVFAVILVFFCQGLDDLRLAVALVALPLVAMAALRNAHRTLEAEGAIAEEFAGVRTSRTIPWKLIALVAVFCFAYGLRAQQLAEGTGVHSSISTGIAMAAFAAVVYFLSDRISLNAVCKSMLPLMLCGFLLIPAEGFLGTVVSSYMISIGYSIMSLLVSLMLYDICKRFGLFAICLLGLKNGMQIFVVAGKDFASLIGMTSLAPAAQEALITGIVVALVFIAAFILYSEKELTSTWGVKFIESEALTEEGLRRKQLTERCDELSRTCKLSPREDEILRLYAQGMNGPQIEKELFIAEGTLKTHTRHIYEKLGVPNRKGLYAALGISA